MGFLIDMIHVGQGDSFLLTLARADRTDVVVLIDAGPESAGTTVADFVTQYAGGKIDVVIATHLDMDHIGGLAEVVRRCPVGTLYMNIPGQSRQTFQKSLRRRLYEGYYPGVYDLKKALKDADNLSAVLVAKNLDPQPVITGMAWQIGDTRLEVLSPDRALLQAAWASMAGDEDEADSISKAYLRTEAPDTSPENNSSVVLEIRYKGLPYALMAGDAGADVLKAVTVGRSYQFLKVSHHGSATGLDEELADQLKAVTAYIPVGSNPYHHPDRGVLELLKSRGAKTYCSGGTDECWRGCPKDGFGNLCHRMDREFRPNWSSVDPNKCANNV